MGPKCLGKMGININFGTVARNEFMGMNTHSLIGEIHGTGQVTFLYCHTVIIFSSGTSNNVLFWKCGSLKHS